MKIKNLLWSVPLAAVAVTGFASGAQAAPTSTWDALAQCESGGNWGTNTGNGFSGGLQFTPSTWSAFGGSGSPQGASKAEQIRVAENVLAGQGWGAWPACSASLGLSGGGGGYTPAPPKATVTPQDTYVENAAPYIKSDKPVPAVEQTAPVVPVQVQAPVETPAPAQVQAPAVEYTTPAVTPRVSQVSGNTYTVVKGDTLSKIADKYNVAGGYRTLFELNKNILNDPNVIEVGQILTLS